MIRKTTAMTTVKSRKGPISVQARMESLEPRMMRSGPMDQIAFLERRMMRNMYHAIQEGEQAAAMQRESGHIDHTTRFRTGPS